MSEKDQGSVVARSTFFLGIGQGMSALISALITVVIARLLQPTNYGIYQAALLPAMLMGTFADMGAGVAATHFIAHARRLEDNFGGYIKAALIMAIFPGAFLAIGLTLFAPFLSDTLLQKPDLTNLVSLTSLMVMATSIINVSNGIYLGLERTEYMALMTMLYSLIRNSLSIMLVMLGQGVLGALLGQISGSIIIAILNLLLILSKFNYADHVVQKFRPLLSYSLPYAGSVIINVVINRFYYFLGIRFLSYEEYGFLSASLVSIGGMAIVVASVAGALLPSFSKFLENEKAAIRYAFRLSVRYASLLILPMTIILYGFSESFIAFLFGEHYMKAAVYLSILSIPYFFAITGVGVVRPALLGLKKTKIVLTINFIALSCSFIWLIYFSREFTGLNIVIAISVSAILGTILGLIYLWFEYKASIDWIFAGKSAIATLIVILCCNVFKTLISVSLLRFFIGGILSIVVFGIAIITLGALNGDDFIRIRSMVRGIPVIGKLVLRIVGLMEWYYRQIYKP